MSTFEEKIRSHRLIRKLRIGLSRIVLPGFQGISLYDSLRFFFKEIFSQHFTFMARAVSFSFLMSLSPFLLFLFTLIPYLPISSENVISSISDTVGLITQSAKFQASVTNLLEDFFAHKKEVLLSFSVLLTLFFSSNGMLGLMISFDRSVEEFKKKNWYSQRLWAILLTVIFIVVIILSLALLLFQEWFFMSYGLEDWIYVGKFFQFVIIGLMLLMTISIIYRYGPATSTRWPLITPGSILATSLFLIITAVFFFAVNNIINYNQIYGSVGTLIIFLVWLFSISEILLIGFALNVTIFVNKKLNIADEPFFPEDVPIEG